MDKKTINSTYGIKSRKATAQDYFLPTSYSVTYTPFKSGDKVVCINDNMERKGAKLSYIKSGETYTVKNPNTGNKDMELESVSDSYYRWDRFMLLSEWQQKKLIELI